MYLARRLVLLVPVSLAALAVACGEGNATLAPTGPTASLTSNLSSDDTSGSERASTLGRDDKGDKGKGGGSEEKPGHGKPEAGDSGKPEKTIHGSLSGFVTAVSATSITVRGIIVTPAPDVVIRHGNRILDFTSIVVGNHVQAKGTMTEGALLANEIKVEETSREGGDELEDDEDDAKVEGEVSGLSNIASCPVVSFTIGSKQITTSASTTFEDVTCAALVNGLDVEVKGVVQSNGSILATKVERD